MVTLQLAGDIAPDRHADVWCNGQPFCRMYMDKYGNTGLSAPDATSALLWGLHASFALDPAAHGEAAEETLALAQADLEKMFAVVNAAQGRLATDAPVALDASAVYERDDDMNHGTLKVFPQEDGDICLTVVDHERECIASVEFCTPFSGGGRSPKTLQALRHLARAMREDQ